MNILGHGVDTVDAIRFGKLFQDGRKEYLDRYFSEAELHQIVPDIENNTPDWNLRIAARFAAKEAVMKSLEHGFGDGLAFTDIEVLTNERGAPKVVLHNKARSEAEAHGIKDFWVSISHSGGIAFASAIACG